MSDAIETKRVRTTPEAFIEAYMGAINANQGPKAVAEITGMKLNSVLVKATQMRKEGVELPLFPKKERTKQTTASLNAIVAKFNEAKKAQEALQS